MVLGVEIWSGAEARSGRISNFKRGWSAEAVLAAAEELEEAKAAICRRSGGDHIGGCGRLSKNPVPRGFQFTS
jgi:hypothetical protein